MDPRLERGLVRRERRGDRALRPSGSAHQARRTRVARQDADHGLEKALHARPEVLRVGRRGPWLDGSHDRSQRPLHDGAEEVRLVVEVVIDDALRERSIFDDGVEGRLLEPMRRERLGGDLEQVLDSIALLNTTLSSEGPRRGSGGAGGDGRALRCSRLRHGMRRSFGADGTTR